MKRPTSYLSLLKNGDSEDVSFPSCMPVVALEYSNVEAEQSLGCRSCPTLASTRSPRRNSNSFPRHIHSKLKNMDDDFSAVHKIQGVAFGPKSTVSYRFGFNSSSTPTVPYSSADLGYSEVNRQGGDISGSDLVCFDREKEKNRLKEYDRQLSGRNNSRRSVSLEKVNYENDREELRPIKNTFPTAKSNQGRPNGLRGNFIRTDQLLNPKNNVSFQTLAREPEDLIAMGTIWSPNVQQRGTAIPANTKSQTLPSQYNSLTAQTIRKGPNGTASRTLLGNQNLNTARKEAEPKYNDPLSGAPASFQQRLMELSSLESETISMELKNSFSKEVMKEASLMLKKLLPKRGTKATQQGKRC